MFNVESGKGVFHVIHKIKLKAHPRRNHGSCEGGSKLIGLFAIFNFKSEYFMSLNSIELPPYVGSRDNKILAILRLKRWKARLWMREKGIRDLGVSQKLAKIQSED